MLKNSDNDISYSNIEIILKKTQFIILNTISLPVRTGPAFTGLQRANFLQNLGYNTILMYPYLINPVDQEKHWGIQMTKEEFKENLYNCLNTSVPVIIYDSIFNLSQVPFNIGDLYENVRPILLQPNILVIEDPEPIYFSSITANFDELFIKKFDLIIGIHHTQYLNIARRQKKIPEDQIELLMRFTIDNWFTKVETIAISSSIAEQINAENVNIIIGNIHGVNENYFDVDFDEKKIKKGSIYCIGKLDVTHKCLNLILECLKKSNNLNVDYFGAGDDLEWIQSNNSNFSYKGSSVNPIQDLKSYEIYISASDLEGVCTATAEALLMHKKAIIRKCTCNEIFEKYNNVFFFENEDDFPKVLETALKAPIKIRDENLQLFRWENCNKNFVKILGEIIQKKKSLFSNNLNN